MTITFLGERQDISDPETAVLVAGQTTETVKARFKRNHDRLLGWGLVIFRAVTEAIEFGKRFPVFGAPGVFLRSDNGVEAGHPDLDTADSELHGGIFKLLIPLSRVPGG
jgi:hypothetical protein